jgi:hypothetical protein
VNQVADGGGGGGRSIIVNHETLTGVATELGNASTAMDGCGSSMPGSSDHGLAGPLLAQMLAAVAETGSRLAFDASTLGGAVAECNKLSSDADSVAAENMLIKAAAK